MNSVAMGARCWFFRMTKRLSPLESNVCSKMESFGGKLRKGRSNLRKQNFSVERIREQYYELYSETLAGREKRGAEARNYRSILAHDSRVRVALVAPSLRYVGGQSVQADLLLQTWGGDPDADARFIPVDPRFKFGLGWVERVPALRTIIREPFYALSLLNLLKNADVVHIFSASYSSFLLAPLPAWRIARLRGKKTLINYHSGECRDHLQLSLVAREVLKGTDQLVVPSGYLVDVLGEFELKALAIPNIVDVSQFEFRVRRPLRPHLVCTRGFHPYYCIDVVVRAFAEVQKVFPDARLDLVGGGPLEGEIRNLVRRDGSQRSQFQGSCCAQRDCALLRRCRHLHQCFPPRQHASLNPGGICRRLAGGQH